MNLNIRPSTAEDKPYISKLILAAFDEAERQEVSELVSNLLNDQSALPMLSLVATYGENIVGHILFTATHLSKSAKDIKSSILCPLSVHPDYQKKGIGRQLITVGLENLQNDNTELVFVLGDPAFYQKFGFTAANQYGLKPPYSQPSEYDEAWMVQNLQSESIEKLQGVVTCAKALSHQKYWL